MPLHYLVYRCQLCSHRPSMESGAVPESPRRPLSAAVKDSARRLLPVQRSGRRLVPSELGAALPVTVWGAGLPMQAVMAAWARGQTLGDVLCVGGRASLTGTTAGNRAERSQWKNQPTLRNKKISFFPQQMALLAYPINSPPDPSGVFYL